MNIISEKRITSTVPFSQKIKSKQQIQRNVSYARDWVVAVRQQCTFPCSPFSPGALDLHTRSTTLEIKICRCTRGQKPSKLRASVAHAVKKVVPWRCDLYKRSRKTLTSGEPLYLMETKMQNIKKVCLCTKLFKNTIFTMYEWWRFQQYCICLKNLGIRISVEKLNLFLVHLGGSIKKKKNSITNPKLRKKKSWGGRYASWCVCGMFETNPKLDNKKS